MVQRIEAALEERKRQRRKAANKPESFPGDRRAALEGRRDKDQRATETVRPGTPVLN
jgi:hypothetical protein